ncbi:MAG: HmuY family protein [Gemmatimonadota bacterium]
MRGPVHFLPLLTTVAAIAFALILVRRYRSRGGRHLAWWAIGMVTYAGGTAAESWVTLFGWDVTVFRLWYVLGALLGGAPLALGSAYLHAGRRAGDIFAASVVAVVGLGAIAVFASPIDYSQVETWRLSGRVLVWQWVRYISPFVNLFAVIFLIGGAIRSAILFGRMPGLRHRAIGNWLIAIGAILPGIGGSFARFGHVEVLYVTEFIGLLLIYAGYRLVTGGDPFPGLAGINTPMQTSLPGTIRLSALLLVALSACATDSPSGPVTSATATIAVDASQTYAYVRLGDPAQTANVPDPLASTAWDLGLFATTVTANGGSAGPGGVTVHCLCANAGATNEQLQGFSPSNQEQAFELVTAAQIPADAGFGADSLSPAIAGWYTGVGGQASVRQRSWLIRRGSTLGKFRITSLQGQSAQNAGSISFEFALQSAPGAAFGTTSQATVDVRGGPVYYDLVNRAVTTASGSWDLRFSAFEIRTNGGVSGAGSMMALPDDAMPFAQISAQYAALPPAAAFRRDAYSGVFNSRPWYRYNITGTDNQIWPLFNVYLVKRGSEVWKVQLTSYYRSDGASRHITLRYARIR